MMTTASPVARCSPASIAASLPKLRLSDVYRTRGSAAASRRSAARVPS